MMVSTFLEHLTLKNKLELHPCEIDLAIGGCLVGPLRPPFWLPVHFVGLLQPLVVHRNRSIQPTDFVQHQLAPSMGREYVRNLSFYDKGLNGSN